MIEYIIIIGVVVLLSLILNVRKRVQKLEQLVELNLAQTVPGQESRSEQIKASPDKLFNAPQEVISGPSIIATEQFKSILPNKLVEWLKENWLLKLGALLLLIGFGWFATYAFLNNWIGPMGRIALGVFAGTLFLFFGWWRIRKYLQQGSVFLVLGSTTILLTLFAAREIYNFFTPAAVLIVMFLSTAFVALASVKHNSRSLALVSLILAGVAPLFTNSPSNPVGLFSYLLVVILGAIWITIITGRRELTTVSLALVACYSLPYFSHSTSADTGILLLFAYAFAAVFFLTNTAGILKLKGKEIMPDLMTAAGNGVFLLFWIMFMAQNEWKSLIISAWMIVFAVGAFLIFKITKRKESFFVYAGVGVAMLAVATWAELKGASLTIAYAIEGGIIPLVIYSIFKDIRVARLAAPLLIWPIVLSFTSMTSHTWATSVLHKDFLVLLILGITLLGLGLFFLRQAKGTKEEKDSKSIDAILLVIGSAFVYIVLWLSLHTIFQNDSYAVMISLIVYVIIGLAAYFYGLSNEKRGLRIYGGALIGFVVLRLLLIDVWKMELSGRIITFFLVGALLVGTAFLGRKK